MNIILKDGTTISAEQNEYFFGIAYDTETVLSEDIFTESNLSEVTIDGENKGYMILDFLRPDGKQFYLREPSKEEAKIHELDKAVFDGGLFRISGASESDVKVPVGTSNKKITLNVPEGYTLASFREISISGNEDVSLNWFGTAGNGTMANLSLRNNGTEEATVTISATCFFVKI